MRKAVFLDRDGVLNAAVVRNGLPYPPANAAEMRVIDGVPQAVAALKRMGYLTIVVTNQPDIARGTTSREAVDAINAKLNESIGVDEFRVCPHDSADHCDCRKPKPGLLLQAATDWGIDLSQSFMVGDRWRDVEAGQQAAVRTFFVSCGYAERQPVGYDWAVASLTEAAAIVEQLNQPVTKKDTE